jgi:hypothetical protein
VPEEARGPSDPERQLLDGITLEEARSQARACVERLSSEQAVAEAEAMGEPPPEEVPPGDVRILLAWVMQGHENVGLGEHTRVLVVSDDPDADPFVQFACSTSGGVGSTGDGRPTPENGQAVSPDSNADRFYIPPTMGEWELPFRWVDYGLVSPEVERVTVTYAGETEEAVIEAGYYAVGGMAEEWPEERPVVIGYGADGEVLYDSREDPTIPDDPIAP